MLPHTPPQPGEGRYTYADVRLIRVIDGDSVVLRFPLPFNTSRELDVRLLGIDAPERVGGSRAAGEAATAHLRRLLEESGPLIAQTHKTDRYGRYLAELWRHHEGLWRNVSAEMLAAGHAVPYDGGPRT